MNNDEKNSKACAAKALFMGRLANDLLFPFPTLPKREDDTTSLVLESIDRFLAGREGEFREFDKKGEQSESYINELKELGLFGLIIPEEYGGLGLSSMEYSRVIQQTSYYDASTSLTVGAHSSIGMKGILLFGTDEQKERYLPRLATGELVAAFCLTEPGSGSDAASITTTAIKNSDGSWTLNGEKIWITNGAFAGLFTVFAKTDSDEGKMTAFIVERSFDGVSTGPKEDKLGIRASATTSVRFTDVRVPPENVLGGEGKGFKVAMSILNSGRTGLGGGCVGAMKHAIASAIAHANQRKQFGKPIAEFALVADKIAQMTVACFATESVVTMVGHYIDSGVEDFSMEAAISKILASESLWFVANEALQIAGGTGYMKEFPFGRLVRDSRINMIFEGTNEVLRLYIALSGLKHTGDYLKGVQTGVSKILNDPIKGFGVLYEYAGKRLSSMAPVGRGKLEGIPSRLAGFARMVETYAASFGGAVEAALREHGTTIVGKQLVSRRLADIAGDLFTSLCVLSRVSTVVAEKGEEASAAELDIAWLFSHGAKRRMNANLRRLGRNEDNASLSLARRMVEWGRYPWDVR